MNLVLNILWFVFGGVISGTLWMLAGLLLLLTVAGIGGMGADPDLGVAPDPVVLRQGLGLEDIQHGVRGLPGIQAPTQGVLIHQPAPADVDQDGAGLEGRKKGVVAHVPGLVRQGTGEHDHIGVRKGFGNPGQGQGAMRQPGVRAPAHDGQVHAESPCPLGDLLADRAVAHQKPARLADLPILGAAPFAPRLQCLLGVDGHNQGQGVGEDVLGDHDPLGGGLGDPDALFHDAPEDRQVEPGVEGLQPADAGAVQQGPHEGGKEPSLISLLGVPDDLRRNVARRKVDAIADKSVQLGDRHDLKLRSQVGDPVPDPVIGRF